MTQNNTPSIYERFKLTILVGVGGLLLVMMLGLLGGCAPQNEVINYRTYTDPEKGIFYIVDSVLEKGELISGTGLDQTRVIITRQAN